MELSRAVGPPSVAMTAQLGRLEQKWDSWLVLQLKSPGVGLASDLPGPVVRHLLPFPLVSSAWASFSGWRPLWVDQAAPSSTRLSACPGISQESVLDPKPIPKPQCWEMDSCDGPASNHVTPTGTGVGVALI